MEHVFKRTNNISYTPNYQAQTIPELMDYSINNLCLYNIETGKEKAISITYNALAHKDRVFLSFLENEMNFYNEKKENPLTRRDIDIRLIKLITHSLSDNAISEYETAATQAQTEDIPNFYTDPKPDIVEWLSNGIIYNLNDDSRFTVEFVEHAGLNGLTFTHCTKTAIELIERELNLKRDKNLAVQLTENTRHAVTVFLNKNGILIMSNVVTIDMLNKVFALLPVIAKEQFTIDEKYFKICQNYAENSDEAIKGLIEYFKKEHDLNILHANTLFRSITKNATRHIRRGLDNSISDLNLRIAQLERDLDQKYATLQQKRQELVACELGLYDLKDVDALKTMIFNNSTLITNTNDRSGDAITIEFAVPLDQFEYDTAEQLINTDAFNCIKNHGLTEIFRKIFLEQEYKLLTRTSVTLNFVNSGITVARQRNENDYVPNPHIVYFNCFGENKTILLKALRENNYLELIPRLLMACRNLNFGDITVLNTFCGKLRNDYYHTPCIQHVETGELISPAVLKQKLNEEQNTNTEVIE